MQFVLSLYVVYFLCNKNNDDFIICGKLHSHSAQLWKLFLKIFVG